MENLLTIDNFIKNIEDKEYGERINICKEFGIKFKDSDKLDKLILDLFKNDVTEFKKDEKQDDEFVKNCEEALKIKFKQSSSSLSPFKEELGVLLSISSKKWKLIKYSLENNIGDTTLLKLKLKQLVKYETSDELYKYILNTNPGYRRMILQLLRQKKDKKLLDKLVEPLEEKVGLPLVYTFITGCSKKAFYDFIKRTTEGFKIQSIFDKLNLKSVIRFHPNLFFEYMQACENVEQLQQCYTNIFNSLQKVQKWKAIVFKIPAIIEEFGTNWLNNMWLDANGRVVVPSLISTISRKINELFPSLWLRILKKVKSVHTAVGFPSLFYSAFQFDKLTQKQTQDVWKDYKKYAIDCQSSYSTSPLIPSPSIENGELEKELGAELYPKVSYNYRSWYFMSWLSLYQQNWQKLKKKVDTKQSKRKIKLANGEVSESKQDFERALHYWTVNHAPAIKYAVDMNAKKSVKALQELDLPLELQMYYTVEMLKQGYQKYGACRWSTMDKVVIALLKKFYRKRRHTQNFDKYDKMYKEVLDLFGTNYGLCMFAGVKVKVDRYGTKDQQLSLYLTILQICPHAIRMKALTRLPLEWVREWMNKSAEEFHKLFELVLRPRFYEQNRRYRTHVDYFKYHPMAAKHKTKVTLTSESKEPKLDFEEFENFEDHPVYTAPVRRAGRGRRRGVAVEVEVEKIVPKLPLEFYSETGCLSQKISKVVDSILQFKEFHSQTPKSKILFYRYLYLKSDREFNTLVSLTKQSSVPLRCQAYHTLMYASAVSGSKKYIKKTLELFSNLKNERILVKKKLVQVLFSGSFEELYPVFLQDADCYGHILKLLFVCLEDQNIDDEFTPKVKEYLENIRKDYIFDVKSVDAEHPLLKCFITFSRYLIRHSESLSQDDLKFEEDDKKDHDLYKYFKRTITSPLELGVEIQWRIALYRFGLSGCIKNWRVDYGRLLEYGSKTTYPKHFKDVDGFVSRIVEAYNSRLQNTIDDFSKIKEVSVLPTYYLPLFAVTGKRWEESSVLKSYASTLFENVAKVEKDQEDLYELVPNFDFVRIFKAVISFYYQNWHENTTMKHFMDIMLQSKLAPSILFKWVTNQRHQLQVSCAKRNRNPTPKQKVALRKKVVERMLKISDSAIYIKFVWQFLVLHRQELLTKFLQKPNSCKGVFYLTPEQRLGYKRWWTSKIDTVYDEDEEEEEEKKIADEPVDYSLMSIEDVFKGKSIPNDKEENYSLQAHYKLNRLTRSQIALYSKSLLTTLLNVNRSNEDRVDAAIRYTLLPTTTYVDLLSMLSTFKSEDEPVGEDEESPKTLPVGVIEALVKGMSCVGDSLNGLKYLTDPKVLGSNRARVAIFCVTRCVKYLKIDTNGLFKLLISDKYITKVKITAVKEILRLMMANPTEDVIEEIKRCLSSKDMHRDAVITIVKQLVVMMSNPLTKDIAVSLLKRAVESENIEVQAAIATIKPTSKVPAVVYYNVSELSTYPRVEALVEDMSTCTIPDHKLATEYFTTILTSLAKSTKEPEIKYLCHIAFIDYFSVLSASDKTTEFYMSAITNIEQFKDPNPIVIAASVKRLIALYNLMVRQIPETHLIAGAGEKAPVHTLGFNQQYATRVINDVLRFYEVVLAGLKNFSIPKHIAKDYLHEVKMQQFDDDFSLQQFEYGIMTVCESLGSLFKNTDKFVIDRYPVFKFGIVDKVSFLRENAGRSISKDKLNLINETLSRFPDAFQLRPAAQCKNSRAPAAILAKKITQDVAWCTDQPVAVMLWEIRRAMIELNYFNTYTDDIKVMNYVSRHLSNGNYYTNQIQMATRYIYHTYLPKDIHPVNSFNMEQHLLKMFLYSRSSGAYWGYGQTLWLECFTGMIMYISQNLEAERVYSSTMNYFCQSILRYSECGYHGDKHHLTIEQLMEKSNLDKIFPPCNVKQVLEQEDTFKKRSGKIAQLSNFVSIYLKQTALYLCNSGMKVIPNEKTMKLLIHELVLMNINEEDNEKLLGKTVRKYLEHKAIHRMNAQQKRIHDKERKFLAINSLIHKKPDTTFMNHVSYTDIQYKNVLEEALMTSHNFVNDGWIFAFMSSDDCSKELAKMIFTRSTIVTQDRRRIY